MNHPNGLLKYLREVIFEWDGEMSNISIITKLVCTNKSTYVKYQRYAKK